MTFADSPQGDLLTTPLCITVLIDRPKHTGGMMALLEYTRCIVSQRAHEPRSRMW